MELRVTAAGATDAAVSPRHHWPAHGNCANCDTRLIGDWCHACGQRAADHHRSLKHLGLEVIESFTHADGRLWRTLSLLVTRPARLTCDYLQGKRASEIPPLRLFLVILLLVFATSSLNRSMRPLDLGTQGVARAHQAITGISMTGPAWLTGWTRTHLLRAVDNPQELVAEAGDWAERFAFLLAPLSAVALRLLFPLRRDLWLFDHMVFAMHSLSFVGIIWLVIALPHWMGWSFHGLVLFALLLALPVHLFMHMRGVYRTGILSTLARMALLFVMTLGVFVLLLTGLALLSLSLLHG